MSVLVPFLLLAFGGCGPRGVVVPPPRQANQICGTSSTPSARDSCAAQPLSIDAATGVAAPVALHDGDPVVMNYGPQGGWHIWTAGIVHGQLSLDTTPGALATRPVEIDVDVVRTSTGMKISGDAADSTADLGSPAYGNWSDGTCSGAFYGHYGKILDATSGITPDVGETYRDIICALEGEELSLTVTLTDLLDGSTASDTVNVIAQLDPVDVAYCH